MEFRKLNIFFVSEKKPARCGLFLKRGAEQWGGVS
jgi:hypothetical protein